MNDFVKFVEFLKNKNAVATTFTIDNSLFSGMRFIKEPITDKLQKLWVSDDSNGDGKIALDFLISCDMKLMGYIAYLDSKVCMYTHNTIKLELLTSGTYKYLPKEAIEKFALNGVEINVLDVEDPRRGYIFDVAAKRVLEDMLVEAEEMYHSGVLKVESNPNAKECNAVNRMAIELFLREKNATTIRQDYSVAERKIRDKLTTQNVADMMLQIPDWDKQIMDELLSDKEVRAEYAKTFDFCDKVNRKIEEIKTSNDLKNVLLRKRFAINKAIPENAMAVTVNFKGNDGKTHSAKFPAYILQKNDVVFYLGEWEAKTVNDRNEVKIFADGDIHLPDIVSIAYRGKTIWENK